MSLKVHHLNCGTMCPVCAKLINGRGGWLEPASMVCHVLLIETPKDGLVLVDTGIGTLDVADATRMGKHFANLARPLLDYHETALAQVLRLGFKAADVRHIVMTHMDLDHAGGLPDFPEATVHIFAPEYVAAMNPSWREKSRYLPVQWMHSPRWKIHETGGEQWYGFDSLRPLTGITEDILMVPLVGHTRGHTGVAVRTNKGWKLHCGDAYFFHGQMNPSHPHTTPGMGFLERVTQTDTRARLRNQERLLDLVRHSGREVEVFCAHDAVEYNRYA